MTEKEIQRINELYHKSKTEGLAPEEKSEQARLRGEYIRAIRQNLKNTLKNVSILEPDGRVTDVGKIIEARDRKKQ